MSWWCGHGTMRTEKKAFFCLTLLHSPSVYFMPTGSWMPLTFLKDSNIISKTLPLCSIFVL